jgi:hypothetical protein
MVVMPLYGRKARISSCQESSTSALLEKHHHHHEIAWKRQESAYCG